MKNVRHIPTNLAPRHLLEKVTKEHYSQVEARYENVLHGLSNQGIKPFFHNSGFILLNGDCNELLPQLKMAGVFADLTVTSPPYNIGKEYETTLPINEYIDWCIQWLNAIYDVTAESGALWLNLGFIPVPELGKAVPIPYLLWDKSPFYFLQEIVWNYGAGVSTKKTFCPRNEKWLFYVKRKDDYIFNLDDVRDPNVKYPNQKKNGKLKCNPLGKNPSDVWQFPKVTSGRNRSSKERTSHPAQFPLQVVDRIVKTSSVVGSLVLDPFAGSSSTGIAAVGNDCCFLGIEINEEYCALSAKRIKAFIDARRFSTNQRSIF